MEIVNSVSLNLSTMTQSLPNDPFPQNLKYFYLDTRTLVSEKSYDFPLF